MNKKIAIIADDLTGANDTGVQFSKQGLDTIVMMDASLFSADTEETVVVFDTGSRAMPPAEAYQSVAQVAALVKTGKFDAVYKKVDSTLRGNLGAEIDAIMDTYGQQVSIVAPAFPQNGRITIGGYHLLQTVPLEATEIARDPICPVKKSHLPTLLVDQTRRGVGHVGTTTLLQGTEAILLEFERLIAQDRSVIVCDVWQDEQFEMIAAAGAKLSKSVLWVGSAGLAEYLPRELGLNTTQVKQMPIIVIAGSVSNVTRSQVARLRRRSNVVYIETDSCALLRPETKAPEIERCFIAAAAAVKASKDVVIASGYNDAIVAETKAQGLSLGFTAQHTSAVVAGALGELCLQLVQKLSPGGLVLTGGDIAVGSCRALGATGLKVIREIASGIPLGVLKGGSHQGLQVVTKAGAFGSEDALEKALDSLKTVR